MSVAHRLKRGAQIYRAEGLEGLMRARGWVRTVPPVPQANTPMQDALAWLEHRPSFTVVQIGAYIGDSQNDPLYTFLRQSLPTRPASVALLVEPVREFFDQLKSAYHGIPNVRFENVAIAEAPEEREFYRLGVDPLAHGRPEWLSQLGSLRATRMTELWENYERPLVDWHNDLQSFWLEHRIVERVQCTTLQQLLEANGIEELDLLQIDAEGSDYAILQTIDFAKVRPRFINYERVLLQGDEPSCRAMLMTAGYALFDWGQDTLGVAVEGGRGGNGRPMRTAPRA